MAKINRLTKGEYYQLEKDNGYWKAIIEVLSDKNTDPFGHLKYDIKVVKAYTTGVNLSWESFYFSQFYYFNIKHLPAYKALYGE